MKREAGIELLRGILMLMIVLVHLTGNGVLRSDTPIAFTEPNWLWANLIDSICYPAVNTFVLISGWFGIRLSIEKVVKLEVPVILYSVILFFIFDPLTLGGAITAILPVITKRYWFLTAYFLLMLVSPFLNSYISTRTREQLIKVLLWALLLFVFIPSFSPHYRMADTRGMDVINFCVLYLVGRCLNVLNIQLSVVKSMSLYIVSTALIFGLTLFVAEQFGINRGWRSFFYSYNNVLVYIQAISLFFLFKQLRFKDAIGKIINWLAPSFFFVYIIHSCPSIGSKLYIWISSADYYYSGMFVLHTIGWAITIFFSCIFIDIIIRRFMLRPVIDRIVKLVQSGYYYTCKRLNLINAETSFKGREV